MKTNLGSAKAKQSFGLCQSPRLGLTLAILGSLAWAIPAHANPVVFSASPMVKVRPDLAAQTDTGTTVTAARNEFVSFQVVVQGNDSGATGVKATFSGLSGPAQIGGTDITLYREAFLQISTPSTPDVSTGAWPDPLVPDVDEIDGQQRSAFPFDVPAGEARAIWVDVHVPTNAPAGVYTGSVNITANGFSATTPVKVTVVDAALPSTASLSSAFLVYSPNICQAHTGTQDCGGSAQMAALVGKYEKMALEHRLTLTNFPQGNPNGDWTEFDATYGPYFDGTVTTRLPGAKMTSIQYFGSRDTTSYGNFQSHFQAKGWLDRAFDYSADEPGYGSSWSTVASRTATVRQGAPNLRTLVTTTIESAQSNGVDGSIDIFTPNIDGIEPYGSSDLREDYVTLLTNPQKKLWLYQSCDQHGCGGGGYVVPGNTSSSGWPSYMVDVAAARNRAMEWVSFREQASGELYYETALDLPNAWSSIFSFGGNGDGTLFYPGTPSEIGGQSDVPVASIRLKMIRLGMQDYEWLQLVNAGDPAFAMKTAQSVMPNNWGANNDGSAIEGARQALIDRYVQLHPPSTPPAPLPGGPSGTPPIGGVQGTGGPSGSPSPSGSSSGSATVSTPGSGGAAPKHGCGSAPGMLIPGALAITLLALGRRRRSC